MITRSAVRDNHEMQPQPRRSASAAARRCQAPHDRDRYFAADARRTISSIQIGAKGDVHPFEQG